MEEMESGHVKKRLSLESIVDFRFSIFDLDQQSAFANRKSRFSFGGVLDSTLGWSAPLPVESRGSLVKSPAKKSNGKTEEMPLAA